MSFFFSSRCVLIMGDEGLQIYNVKKHAVKRVADLPWESPDFMEEAQDAIVKKCRRASVVVLNDMVEQHYRKERIPKVSPIDQENVVKRRLGIAFPSYRVRAALKLKDKNSPASGDKKGAPYLFAAIPASDFFNKTLDAVRVSGAPIIGFFLLPVEASSMVNLLSTKLANKRDSKPTWSIFVGQHQNGGLRQIVVRNGELALTRLTPVVDTDVEPELWAKEVAGELEATMSYLTRFGYQPTDGLDVIISANEICHSFLDKFVNTDGNLHLMNSPEIARLLGVKLGPQQDFRYTDPVHASFLARKRSFTLPLQSVAISQLTQPRKITSIATFILLIGAIYFGYTAFKNFTQSLDVQNKSLVAMQQSQSLREEYRLELEKQKAMGFDFLLVDNAIQIYDTLEMGKIKPLPVIREIGQVLGSDISLDDLKIERKIENVKTDQITFDEMGNQTKFKERIVMDAMLTISFPSLVSPDVGVRKVNEIRNKLATSLMDYEVTIAKQVADLSYAGSFTGGSGVGQNAEQTSDKYQAIIQIVGEVE